MKITVISGLLIFLTSCSSAPGGPPAGMEPPPVPVRTAVAMTEVVPTQVRAVGTVEAYSSVGVKAQVGGQLLSVKFTEGTNVREGDLLFEIDPRPFREALRQAEANLRRDEAELKVAEANLARDQARLKNARAEAARYEQLLSEGISTRMQEAEIRTAAEVAEQSVRADEAALESIRAALESSRAAVDQARLNLSYTQVVAPISGRTGSLLLHQGNLVQANSEMPLVVINQISPISVVFGVPERYLEAIFEKQRSKQKLIVEATPGEGSQSVARGTLSVVDNQVDTSTGTIRLKASFDNRNGELWPGQFVNVTLTLDTQPATITPSEAIQSGQQGPFVYVVTPGNTAEVRPVEIGQIVAGNIVIESGIMPGETVVTDGQSRLYPGAKVTLVQDTPTAGVN